MSISIRYFLLLVLIATYQLSFATSYYIAANGDDSNAGTSIAAPIQSINQANSLILSAGDSLLFRAGDIFFGQLEINYSGNASKPIFVGSYGNGAMPEIRGGDILTNWVLHEGSIYKRALTNPIGILTVDDEQAMVARHPNTSWFFLDVGNPNTTAIDAERIGDPDWTGANLLVMENDWSLNPFKVSSFDASTGTFVLDAGINSLNSSIGVEYYIANHLEALDSPGEWFHDTISDTLFLWTLEHDSPDNHLVMGGIKDYGILINGNYVNVRGLRIQCYNHSGVRFNNRHHIEIKGNDVKNVRNNGIYCLFGHDNSIIDNKIENTGQYGILGFVSPKARIEENHVRYVALEKNVSESGLGASKGTGIRLSGDSTIFRRNIIQDIGYNGINYGGEACIIEENIIKYFCKTTWDGGAIYAWSPNFDSIGSANTVIRKNIIIGGLSDTIHRFSDNRSACGIYTDNHLHDILIEDNFAAYTTRGIFLHNNKRIEVKNNALYNNWENDIRLTTDVLVDEGDMEDNSVTNNRMFRSDTTRLNFGVHCRWSSWDLGQYDSNYLYNPHIPEVINFEYRPDDINKSSFTWLLSEWQNFSNNDIASDTADFTWPVPEDYSMFLVNETESEQTFLLSSPWTDFQNNLHASSISLAPYSGKILWQIPDCEDLIGGSAFIDSCGICAGGDTGIVPILDSTLCDPAAIYHSEAMEYFKVNPNPSRDLFTVTIQSNTSERMTIELMDLNGIRRAKIWNGQVNGDEEIEFSAWNLPSGVYLMSMSNSKGIIYSKRIVLTR